MNPKEPHTLSRARDSELHEIMVEAERVCSRLARGRFTLTVERLGFCCTKHDMHCDRATETDIERLMREIPGHRRGDY